MHIYIPLEAKYEYEIARNFAHLICKLVNNKIPKITSLERNPSKRKHKVYLDYLQNRQGQTLAAPYSVRPRREAPVSTPLKWDELKKSLYPEQFTIVNLHKRLKTGDILKVSWKRIDIEKCIFRRKGIKKLVDQIFFKYYLMHSIAV
jgi:bifunctional non-homologous end joining protein LigD